MRKHSIHRKKRRDASIYGKLARLFFYAVNVRMHIHLATDGMSDKSSKAGFMPMAGNFVHT